MSREFGTGAGGTGGTGTGGALHSTVRQQLALVLDSPHTHSSGTSYLFLGAHVGPAVEEGTDTDRKVGTQREERRETERRERKSRECAQSYMLPRGISTQNAISPVLSCPFARPANCVLHRQSGD